MARRSAVVYADDEVAFNCGGVEWIVESIAVGDERADRQNYLDNLLVFPETMDFAGGTGGRLAGDDKRPAQAGFGCKPLVDLPAVDGCRQIDGQILLFYALGTKSTVEDTDFGIEGREGLFADKLQAGAGRGPVLGLAAGSGRNGCAAWVVTSRRAGVAGDTNVLLPVFGKVGQELIDRGEFIVDVTVDHGGCARTRRAFFPGSIRDLIAICSGMTSFGLR